MTEFPKVADLTSSFALFAFVKGEGLDDEIYVLLGKRKSTAKAFPGAWCIPGGFLNVGERFKACAIRELREETGIDVEKIELFHPGIMEVGMFDDPERDARGRIVDYPYTAAFWNSNPDLPQPDLSHEECDLEDAQWIPVSKLPDMELAFDHNKILRQAYIQVLHT